MKDTDDRTAASLPVTAEVGGEGGSFADPTVQVASVEGKVDRTGSDGDSEIASRPIRAESVSRHADDVKSGMAKHPNEK
jgi:hypothetical protein